MKIDRLVGILAKLMQKDMVTAPELAEQFEVSRRTINRDIDSLCKAGIPICTRQGVNGGISIMPDYRIDRTLLSSRDMQDILAGLRGLDSVSGNRQYIQLMEKISAGSSNFVSSRDTILIDLSSWYKDSLASKIKIIQLAVEEKKLLSFLYYAPKGDSSRLIEPYYLVFRWSSWYVWGWCTEREDFRLFKLNRMENTTVGGKFCDDRSVPMPDLSDDRVFPGGIKVNALFAPVVKWRLVEEFGPHCFSEQEDDWLLFQGDFTNKDNLLGWLMTFGDKVKLLEPMSIRDELLNMAKNIIRIYQED